MLTKICTKCCKELPITAFTKKSVSKDGHDCRCRSCRSVDGQLYRQSNRKQDLLRKRVWYSNNKARQKQAVKEWQHRNRGLSTYYTLKPRLDMCTPCWSNEEAKKDFYINRPKGMVVDHIIPLKSDLVCGLHIVENLQYLTPKQNGKKYNHFNQDQHVQTPKVLAS